MSQPPGDFQRPCFGCRVFDDHPRHEISDPESGSDTHGGPMHMDCCAALRGCELCRAILERAYGLAGGGATGQDLRDALVQLPPMDIQHGPTPFTAVVTEIHPDDMVVRNG